MPMSNRGKDRILENLCATHQDMSRRILTCERRGRDGIRLSYDDLVAWSDVIGDAIEVIHEKEDSRCRNE